MNFGPPGPIRELPAPSGYRQMTPAGLALPPVSAKAKLFERKRVIVGLGIAAALHLTLGLAWWLSPPLRLKAGYGPDRWVAVVSLPKPDPGPAKPSPAATQEPKPTGSAAAAPHVPSAARKSHGTHRVVAQGPAPPPG